MFREKLDRRRKGATTATRVTEASAKHAVRGKERKRKKEQQLELDTSCRTEATVGLIKLRELAEVSSGLFRGGGEGEGETGTVLYSDTNKFSRNGIVFEVDTFAE